VNGPPRTRVRVASTVALTVGLGVLVLGPVATSPAGATTDATALVGEGGSFLQPVTNLVLKVDPGLAPLNPSYTDANVDDAIGDFVGTGKGQFGADFVVSERPLSSAEAAAAKADGRPYAYVPIAATPVAIATLVICNAVDLASGTETSSTFCRNLPLTPQLVAGIFTDGLTTTSSSIPARLAGWKDPRLTLANGQPVPDGAGINTASELEPSASNTALMTYIDSDPVARAEFDNALANPANSANQGTDTPSEVWPFHTQHAFVGGDAGLIGKELSINAETNAPVSLTAWLGLGSDGTSDHDAFPLPGVWTGAPEGTPWNIPTAAIKNAHGSFVGPTEAAAAAAETSTTIDPQTNLVTFEPSTTDAGAYNNDLMVESYMVVPTSGLPAEKATKLAQLIRFMVGPKAAVIETTLGAAPPTAAMQTADLKVADELDAEAAASTPSTTASTTTTEPATTTTSGAVAGTDAGTSTDSGSTGTNGSTASDASSLAFTGDAGLFPLLVSGAVLVLIGVAVRRRLRRAKVVP